MTVPRRRDTVDSREVDGEVVVWDGTSLHLLDEPAAAVWRLLDGRLSTTDIATLLTQQFVADPAEVAADVADLIDSLEARGLVERSATD